MALFTRRVIQRSIDEGSHASMKAKRRWIKILNGDNDFDSIAAEWEIVILGALAQFGNMQHEPDLPGRAKPDIRFEQDDLCFIADITTVSDRGLIEQNAINELSEELLKIYQHERLMTGALVLNVLDLSFTFGAAKRKRRLVPPKSEFRNIIFNQKFHIWLATIRSEPAQPTNFDVIYRNPRSIIRIAYIPGERGSWCGQYTDFRIPSVVDKNPLYYALCGKADQLRRSAFVDGKRGIILCDGGTRALSEFCGEINASTIIFKFLGDFPDVDFVLTLSLRNIHSGTIRQRIAPQLYALGNHTWHTHLEHLFTNLVTSLPQVQQNAGNARSQLDFDRKSQPVHLGVLTVQYGFPVQSIKISTRTLMDLLSGRVTASKLNAHYQHGSTGQGVFEYLANSGLMIQKAAVVRKLDEDDDEIELTFNGPDPAVSPFRLRPTEPKSDG